ncbi:probable serine/threonine-protein kinase DDB_G0281745 isoform X2 [Oscarella lobularis]|uniref:probable serine/threonine-protein kinase DDB_G0281745 isoform X2 n=1 Tax=Oscarella lobularis TaxID=121494 RepID=UPI003313F428
MREVQKASQDLRERSAQAETDLRRMSEHCAQLEQERDEARLVAQEAQRNLSQYENVYQISSADIDISDVKLGGGSYGDVRVGRWRGCNVAVKTFYEFLRIDEYLRRLEQEISMCSQVHHPNVLSLLGVITQDDIPLRIISELLKASLSDIIAAAGGRLCLREQVDVAMGCSSGICYLHGLGILHGGIRSTNIVVTSLMEAKIFDLGAARFSEVSSLSAGPMSAD